MPRMGFQRRLCLPRADARKLEHVLAVFLQPSVAPELLIEHRRRP